MENLISILENFQVPNSNYEFEIISNGFINDTYLVSSKDEPLYILQKLNTQIFTNFHAIIRNLDLVLPILKDSDYMEVTLIKSIKGESFINKGNDEVWRLMTFVKDSMVFNTTTDPKIAFEAGRIIGLFHKIVHNFDAVKLENIIPKFHDIGFRYEQFKEALSQAKENRIERAKDAIIFVNENISTLLEIQIDNLPKRVCHNDTKLNNILFSESKRSLCLIDLDTIMEGCFLFDFGDAVRTIVNSAREDEKDLSKINFDIELFDGFVNGLVLHGNILSKEEKELLPLGVVLMPFLHGIRALTDYLENDKYYKVSYKNQNLDRCLSLFTFAKLALENQKKMRDVIADKLN
jgi:Ser/Thr protein kinase RdoA (MazF antagonist)